MPLYEYRCSTCGEYYEEMASLDEYNEPIPCTCGDYAERIIASAPAIIGTDTWSDTKFNPHYDAQLGKYFSTKEEKLNHLKKEDLTYTGSFSPRKSSLGMTKCTKEQSKVLSEKNVGQVDQNKKITVGAFTHK